MGANDRALDKKGSAKDRAAAKVSYDADFRGYINLDLTEADKRGFDEWAVSASFEIQLDAFVRDGVRVSVKLDLGSLGFIASGMQTRTTSPNAGLIVTARAKDPMLALWRLVFCLTLLSHTERWEDTKRVADPDRW